MRTYMIIRIKRYDGYDIFDIREGKRRVGALTIEADDKENEILLKLK